jgi:acyl carrier protein
MRSNPPFVDKPSRAAASPLSELLARITGRSVQNLTADVNLESGLGLSSLERVDLLSALEDRYQIDLSETKFANAATVGDLEKLLQGGRVESERGARSALRDQQLQFRDLQSAAFHYPRWTLRWPTTWLRLASHYLLARPAMFLLGWPRITGRENLRGVRGPLLVVSNHIDDVDVGFIQTALPSRIRHKLATATGGEALEMLRSPAPGRVWFGRIYDRLQWTLGVALLNLFPLPRQSGFRKSFAYAGEAVDRGYSVLVFPEGSTRKMAIFCHSAPELGYSPTICVSRSFPCGSLVCLKSKSPGENLPPPERLRCASASPCSSHQKPIPPKSRGRCKRRLRNCRARAERPVLRKPLRSRRVRT